MILLNPRFRLFIGGENPYVFLCLNIAEVCFQPPFYGVQKTLYPSALFLCKTDEKLFFSLLSLVATCALLNTANNKIRHSQNRFDSVVLGDVILFQLANKFNLLKSAFLLFL